MSLSYYDFDLNYIIEHKYFVMKNLEVAGFENTDGDPYDVICPTPCVLSGSAMGAINSLDCATIIEMMGCIDSGL